MKFNFKVYFLDILALVIFWTPLVLLVSWLIFGATVEQLIYVGVGSIASDIAFGALFGRFLNKWRSWRRYA